jgi:F-type H+-transporting ATPase subunit gamma
MAASWFEDDDTAKRALPVYTSENKTLLVPMTSDRGLCGGINSAIVREIKDMIAKSGRRDRYVVFPVGDKGTAALLRPFADILPASLVSLATPVSYGTAASIAHYLEEAMKEHGCDRIELVYTRFVNKLKTEIQKLEVMDRQGFRNGHYKCLYEVEEPDFPLATEIYYDLYIASSVYHCLLNSITAEQSSRMNAMESASKNCGELIDKLQLEYNKVRQAKITQELCEIISGAEAAH